MKAAVLHEIGGTPRYEDFPDPVPGEGEVLIEVRAVAVENVDKVIAAGRHYAGGNYLTELPMIPGLDGTWRPFRSAISKRPGSEPACTGNDLSCARSGSLPD